jgi:hypothetical protein
VRGLARLPLQGGNAGSNPVGDTNQNRPPTRDDARRRIELSVAGLRPGPIRETLGLLPPPRLHNAARVGALAEQRIETVHCGLRAVLEQAAISGQGKATLLRPAHYETSRTLHPAATKIATSPESNCSPSRRRVSIVEVLTTSAYSSIVTAILLCRRICIATRGCKGRRRGAGRPQLWRSPRIAVTARPSTPWPAWAAVPAHPDLRGHIPRSSFIQRCTSRIVSRSRALRARLAGVRVLAALRAGPPWRRSSQL